MEAIIRKWGNSLGVRIPSNIAKDISIVEGSHVEIEDKDGQIIIRPRNKYDLKEMLKDIKKSNIHEEIDNSGPIGNEVW
jgi:antitoxin MazE